MIKNFFLNVRVSIVLALLVGGVPDIMANESLSPYAEGSVAVGQRASHGNYPPPKEDVQRHDLKNEKISNFKHQIISDNSIRVSFQTGASNCYGARAIIKENDDTIEIAVFQGTLPEAPQVCTMVGRLTFFILHTQRPIGGRKIVQMKK